MMLDNAMDLQPPDCESLLQQLYDDNRLIRSIAARKLKDFPKTTLPAVARFYELTFDDPAIGAICRVAIENMKSAAVPFLLEQTRVKDAARRERAIELLSVVGHCGGQPHSFATQLLGSRNESLPDWGNHIEEVLNELSHALSDSDFSVRFAAASVLDDCNHLIEQTIPVFIEALSQGGSFQKNWAALRLGRIGPMARAARDALTQLAVAPADQEDVWDKYASQAAQVALKIIG
jgi:hypothetical protein